MSEKLSSSIGMNAEDFKTGVAQLNRELRVVKSEFAATASTFSDWTKDIDGLEARTKSLNAQIEIQGQKVAATRAEYERMVEAHGADSRAAQEAEIKYNNETATLNKLNTELTDTEKSMDEVKNSSEGAGKGVKDMGDKSENLKAVLGGLTAGVKLSIAAMMAMVTVMRAVVAGIGAMVFTSATAADQLATLSEQAGISTDRLQELKFAGNQIGVSLETITGSQAKLIRAMQSGRDGTGAQADAFAALGVRVTDANGKLRDSETVFGETLDALKQIKDPTERDAQAMALFGKSAQELNPLINTGSEGLKAYAKQAHEMGAVVDGETIQALGNFSDTVDGIKDGLQGVITAIAGAFLPGFADIAGKVQGYVGQLAEAVNGSRGIGGMASAVGKVFVQIAQDIAASAPQMLQAGVDVLQGVTTAILAALPSLVPAATGILTGLVKFLGDALPLMIDAGLGVVLALVNTILPALPQLVDVGLKAIIKLADGLSKAIPKLIPTIAKVIVDISKMFVQNLPVILTVAITLITALATGLTDAIPILIPAIPEIIKAVFDAFMENRGPLADAAGEMIATLVMGLIAAIPVVLSAVGQVAAQIIGQMGYLLSSGTLIEMGEDFISGLWSGIQAGWNDLIENLNNLIAQLPDAIQQMLGIGGSSSLLPFASNFGATIADQVNLMRQQLRLATVGFGNLAGAGAGGAYGQNNSISNQTTAYDNRLELRAQQIIFNGNQTPGSIGEIARQKARRY